MQIKTFFCLILKISVYIRLMNLPILSLTKFLFLYEDLYRLNYVFIMYLLAVNFCENNSR